MRLREIALFGQVRHHIPDGRRTERIMTPLRNRARSHRFPGIDIRPDNRRQDVLIPEIEWRVRSHRPLSTNTSLNTSLVGRMATGQIAMPWVVQASACQN